MQREYCGADVQMPFQNDFCQGYFCTEHRLAGDHNALKHLPEPAWKLGSEAKENRKTYEGNQRDDFRRRLTLIKKELPTLDLGKKEKEAMISFLGRKGKGLIHE